MQLSQNNIIINNKCSEREILFSKEYFVPGSLLFRFQKYPLLKGEIVDEKGEVKYHLSEKNNSAKFQLKFCVLGNQYCTIENCKNCSEKAYAHCKGNVDTIDLFSFKFNPQFFEQFTENNLQNIQEKFIRFSDSCTLNRTFILNRRKKHLLNQLQETSYCGALQNVVFNAIVQELLFTSIQALEDTKKPIVFACKFLADNAGKEKMYEAKKILLENLGTPISIKELSKKVAINECYLKKGFKEVFGITINDFYLQQKMEHAKYLLYEEKQTVTDVSAILGYSSISHFSTAFKRQTGLKPCDLLR